MRIAITGASGFVASAVLKAARAEGIDTIAITRGPQGIADATRLAVVARYERSALARAMEGADAVVHCAARVHVMRDEGEAGRDAFQRVNVDGTREVVAAASQAGVARFVHLSTAKVHGEGRPAPYRPEDPLSPAGPYAASKAEAERLLRTEAPPGVGWTILRPPLVYGPGVGGNFRRLLRLADVAARVPLPLGGLDNSRSLVSVGNLAAAILRAIRTDAARGRAFLVSDGEDLSTTGLLRRLGAALERPVRLFSVPGPMLTAAFAVAGRRRESQRLFESFRVDPSTLWETVGPPPQSVDDGLRAVADWWRASRRPS